MFCVLLLFFSVVVLAEGYKSDVICDSMFDCKSLEDYPICFEGYCVTVNDALRDYIYSRYEHDVICGSVDCEGCDKGRLISASIGSQGYNIFYCKECSVQGSFECKEGYYCEDDFCILNESYTMEEEDDVSLEEEKFIEENENDEEDEYDEVVRVESDYCNDFEGEIDYYEYGRVKGIRDNGLFDSHDVCRGDTLFEVYCEGDKLAGKEYFCVNGCFDGRCLDDEEVDEEINEEADEGVQFCIDYDDGKDYYVKSYIKTEEGILYDYCEDSIVLSEFYCRGKYEDYGYQNLYNCSHGCQDGECLNDSSKDLYYEDKEESSASKDEGFIARLFSWFRNLF